MQEALVIAHLKLDGLLDSEAFVGWIRSIVRRRCLHSVKGLAGVALGDLGEISGGEDLYATITDRLDRERVLAAVAELSEEQRQVFRLHYEEGLSHERTGAKLGLSKETVNMRLHAARTRLRRRLISMNLNDSVMAHVGHVVSADGALITMQFPSDAVPLLVARLVSGGENLCVVRRLPEGQIQAVPTAEGGIWTPGREVQNTGEPFVEPLMNETVARLARLTGQDAVFLPTGIKTIDMFAPMAQSGTAGIFAEWGVGILVLLPELVRRLDSPANRQTIFAFVPPIRDEQQWREVNGEITLGSIRTEVFYIPVGDPVSRPFVDGSASLDTKLVLSRRLAEQGIFPSIDPLRSSSRVHKLGRKQTSEEVCALLQQYHSLQFASEAEAERSLTQDEWVAVRRARLASRFLSQPFFVAEPYTGVPGVDADIEVVAQTFAGILAGKYDACSKEAFTMTGATPKEAK